MVKVVMENRDVLHGIEDRLSAAIHDVVQRGKTTESMRSSHKKVLQTKLTQIGTSFIQKVKRNTRLADDDWSDAEDDEPPSKVAKTGTIAPQPHARRRGWPWIRLWQECAI